MTSALVSPENARPRVSCIIPAYNEQDRIGLVLGAVIGHPLIDEVIVVDDGSKDETARIAQGMDGPHVIVCAKNGGKSRALATGIEAATGEILLLIDADLVALTPAHLTALVEPVLSGRADVSISLRDNTPGVWKAIGLDHISGERAFPRALIAGHLDEVRALPKFGFEVFFNKLCVAQRCRLAVVKWANVESPLKYKKYGFLKGWTADAKMFADLCKTVPPLVLVAQILAMLRLRVELAPEAPRPHRFFRIGRR